MLLSHGMANISMCANQYKQYSINVYDTTSMHTHTMYVRYVYVCLCRSHTLMMKCYLYEHWICPTLYNIMTSYPGHPM